MRTIKNKTVLMLVLIFLAGAAVNAQSSKEKSHGIAGLSEDQKAQMHKLRVSHLKDIQGLRNQVRENRAHYKTLMTADIADMNAINKNIEEFGSLRNQLEKKQAAHIQDIRKLLNDEQRLMFDQKMAERGHFERNMQGRMKGHAVAPAWKKSGQKSMDMKQGPQ